MKKTPPIIEPPQDWSIDKPLPEDADIAEAHPSRSGDYAQYAEALRLVSAKHSKYALVDLVNWLLSRVEYRGDNE